MPKITEEEIEFNFKYETILKYDDSPFHKRCNQNDKKGIDFLYKVNSNLLLIEVKDYNTNTSKKSSTETKKIINDRKKSLEIEEKNPYEQISLNIEQKVNDTLLNIFSSTFNKNNKNELKTYVTGIQKITIILIIDLSYELQASLAPIEAKLNKKLEKLKCIFDTDLLILNSTTQLDSFTMKRILPKKQIKQNQNSLYIYDSVQKTKLPFESIIPRKASIYICGPTVYDDAHLGHARSIFC